jgi:hypothetical protein
MTQPPTRDETPAMSLAEAANVLVIKLRMECKQPHLADEVKSLFDKTFSSMRSETTNINKDPIELAKKCMDDQPDVEDVIKAVDKLRGSDPALYDVVVNTIIASIPMSLPESDIDSSKGVDYRSAKPLKGTWPLVQRDHNVLLALARAYRFLSGASESELQLYGHSRTTLATKIRALEISAAIQGIEI